MDTFTVRDLRERTGDLIRVAVDGRLSLVTCYGKPVFVAVPFDEALHKCGVHVAVAVKEAGQNNIYIRPHPSHHCCVTGSIHEACPAGLPAAVQTRSRRVCAYLGKGAAITCETRLALMAQPRPRC